jgi:hypothetical protein
MCSEPLILASRYIRINELRKKLEYQENELKQKLEQYFETSGHSEIITSKGTLRHTDVEHNEYDADLLRKSMPSELFDLATRIVVSNSVLEELAKQGKIDQRIILLAKKVKLSKRFIVVATKKPIL